MSTYDQEEEIEGICAVLEVVYWADWEVVIVSYQDMARITKKITKTIVKIILVVCSFLFYHVIYYVVSCE